MNKQKTKDRKKNHDIQGLTQEDHHIENRSPINEEEKSRLDKKLSKK